MNRSRCSRTKNSIGRKRQPAQKVARVLQEAAPKTKGPGIARRGLGYRGRQTTTVCLLHHVKFEAAESHGFLPLGRSGYYPPSSCRAALSRVSNSCCFRRRVISFWPTARLPFLSTISVTISRRSSLTCSITFMTFSRWSVLILFLSVVG